MRAADSKGSPPPPSPPLFSQLQANDSVLDNSQHVYMKRYQESPMRVESSAMSDPSCGLHRAALGEECLDDDCEDEEQMKDRLGRREEEEERMTQSPDALIGSINLHMELATKNREVSHLVDEMQRLQSSINNLKEISTSKISQLTDMVTEKDRVIKDLAEKLLRQQDYTDLKRELRLLKALDMGGWQSWGGEQMEMPSPANDKTPSEPVDTNGARMTPPSEDESGQDDAASTPPSADPVVDSVSTDQLQRCLRMNVDRFCGEPLNTLSISRCVRELLSINNIGQRLFAKLVLGLSQGTVSELLSKPKPWDKLTEKGRDSYRKMHAWACDQHCVMLLKSLLPKKGREGSSKPESEERPVQTNPEAPPAPSTEDNNNNNNNPEVSMASLPHAPHKDMRHQMHHMGHHPMYPDVMNGSKAFCHYGPEFPPVMLAHIYQEELLKLIGKRMKEGQPEEQAKQAQDEIRQALAIYHRELTLLAAQGSHHPDASCHACPLHRRPDCGIPYCRDQPACCLPHPQQQNTHEHSGFFSADAMKVLSPYSVASPLIPLPPEGQQTSNSATEESSPLQRMQSITNSLLNQASTPSFNSLPHRPMKAVLPPITQQQFDHYNNLNTEDIVKRVKEQLSQYSISQRLFGESVLGLSQGSVSDLLARPKPWHMLTQKGREPFIRMKMFLEDENAVHKLVASQYKIAPERLMRMGGYGGVPLPPGTTRFSPVSSTEPTYPSSHRQIPPSTKPSSPQPPSTPPERSPSAPLTAHSPSGSASLPSSANLKGSGRRGGRCLAPYVQPSVYEMAAVTTDLDTQIITARIKETLTVHNIGQKLFGEAVLGLSQGSVSELLSKPKPWHMLSIKGREPFIRMQLWLNDPSNVEKLQAIKTERREANKRRRNAIDADGPSPHLPCGDPQQQFPLDPLFLYPSSAKKPRILFSEEQKEALKLAYTLDPYPSTAVMEFLSAELGLSVRTITNWFHNHRMRLKQQNQEEPSYPTSQENTTSSFDPIRFRLLLGQRLAEMCKSQQQASQMLPYFSEAQRTMCPLPGLTPPYAVGKLEDSTLDLSVSSHQYSHSKDDRMEKDEDGGRRSSESVPTRASSSSSSQLTHPAAIDLTPSSDKSTPNFNSRISPLGFSRGPSAKCSLDLSFSTFQKLTGQDLQTSVASNNLSIDLVTRSNTTSDIEAILRGSSSTTRLDFSSTGSAMDSPVDLRDDKRPNTIAPASGGSSNRRKAAAPQWVDPGLDLSPDSDICGFEEDDDDDTNEALDTSSTGGGQVINGVCVRQTDFSAHPAGTDVLIKVESNEMSFCGANKKAEDKFKFEREQNIRRLERAITDHDEQWDDISDDEDMCSRT